MSGNLEPRLSKLERRRNPDVLPSVDEIWLCGPDDSTSVLYWTNPNKEKTDDQLATQ